jgi:uncharacterized protein (TIGR02246 family)
VEPPEVVTSRGADAGEAVAEIEAFVARLQAAQQAEDVAGFMALFAKHAVWTTAHGKRIAGRGAIHEFTETVLPGAMRESTARYDIERIAFLRPDVAVVSVRQRPVTLEEIPWRERLKDSQPTC